MDVEFNKVLNLADMKPLLYFPALGSPLEKMAYEGGALFGREAPVFSAKEFATEQLRHLRP